MIAMVGLEVFQPRPRLKLNGKAPWVAKITGLTENGKFSRNFLRGSTDYTYANNSGSRGIYRWYHLRSGRVYEIANRQSWKEMERYFCCVTEDGEIVRMTGQEVLNTFLEKA